MLARATTFTLLGIEGIRVTVEADIHTGLPSFTIVGLGDAAVQESRERVRAALVNSGFDFPLRRITVNLAPADLRKAGPAFDLALAAGLLAASGQAPPDRLAGHAFCGELGLDGSVRRVRGAIAMADAAATAGCEGIVVPSDNAGEAALVGGLDVVPVGTVRELAAFLGGDGPPVAERLDARDWLATDPPEGEDFAQLRGHRALKHALEVAAAGNHNVLMMGPPGSGKSMAARRLPSIMPPLSFGDALEVTRIHSVAGVLGPAPLVQRRPFRAPHHSISAPGLVGGGGPPTPGEASLAQHGVLFLDELSEFARPALEALRQPLEEGCVRITRAQRTVSFPARFLLAAATNPCPCGYQGDPRRECSCHPSVAARYRARLSGPLLDRIDMILRVEQPRAKDVMAEAEPEGSRTSGNACWQLARCRSGACAGARPHATPTCPMPSCAGWPISNRRPAQRSMTLTSVRVSRCVDTIASCGWRGRSPTWTARTASFAGMLRRPSHTGSLRPCWTARWPGCLM